MLFLPASVGEQFWHHIEQRPWSDNRVDYQKINRPVITLDLWVADTAQFAEFLGLSSLSQFTFLALATGTNKAVALIPFNDALQFPEQLLTAQGDAAIFAANSPDEYFFDEFLLSWSWQATAFRRNPPAYAK